MQYVSSVIIANVFVAILLGQDKLQGIELTIRRNITASFTVALDTNKWDKPVFVSASCNHELSTCLTHDL